MKRLGLLSLSVAGFVLLAFEDSMGKSSTPAAQSAEASSAAPCHGIRVLTLNLAHGRGERQNQIFLDRETIERHLDRIAGLIAREQPDVVALQEADDVSRWSGRFDHVAYLAEKAGLPYVLAGSHARSPFFDYGTALLARDPLLEPESVSFPRSFPTFTKGYVRALLANPDPDSGPAQVQVVSLHLDFSRESVRREQARALVEDLSARDRALVVMGDFNSEWTEADSIVKIVARELGLEAFSEQRSDVTYPRLERRLDWILLSEGLSFGSYRTLSDKVSDHRAVVADICFR